jgi:hypothetical protein
MAVLIGNIVRGDLNLHALQLLVEIREKKAEMGGRTKPKHGVPE